MRRLLTGACIGSYTAAPPPPAQPPTLIGRRAPLPLLKPAPKKYGRLSSCATLFTSGVIVSWSASRVTTGMSIRCSIARIIPSTHSILRTTHWSKPSCSAARTRGGAPGSPCGDSHGSAPVPSDMLMLGNEVGMAGVEMPFHLHDLTLAPRRRAHRTLGTLDHRLRGLQFTLGLGAPALLGVVLLPGVLGVLTR